MGRDLSLYVTDSFVDDIETEDDSGSSISNEDEVRREPKKCPLTYVIRLFGLSEKGEPITVNVEGFRPYFFIKIPETWNNTTCSRFIGLIRGKVSSYYSDTLVEWKLLHSKPFYGFTGDDKFKFLKLLFKSHVGMRKFEYIFRDKLKLPGLNKGQGYLYQRYESDMPPLLRFIHTNNLVATGWTTVSEYTRNHMAATTATIEINAHWTKIQPDPDKLELLPPPIKYVGFDIESNSSHGDFPIAIKTYQKLARDMINVYNTHPVKDSREFIRYMLSLGFNKYYSANAVGHVVVRDELEPTVRDEVALETHRILESDESPDITEQLFDLFETKLPPFSLEDDGIDYYTFATLVLAEHRRLVRTNNLVYRDSPVQVICTIFDVSFSKYGSVDINVVYTKRGKVPDSMLLDLIVPDVYDVCQRANVVYLKDKKGIPTYRKDESRVTIDQFADELTDIFNLRFPPIKGDEIIQIGSTFKRYGESDCYLKHIICLGGCSPINNENLVLHENRDIYLPDKTIAMELGMKMSELESLSPPEKDALNERVVNARRDRQLREDQAEVVVETYETEEQVLLAWQRLIQRENPDLVIGYNIFGFDFKYMYNRAAELGILEEFCQLGRIKGVQQELVEQQLVSAGLGDNLLYYIDMHGRVLIDMFKVMQTTASLDSYTLDNVCKIYLSKTKNDLPPKELFIKQNGSDDDRRDIAEYCLIDCILCNRLIDKLETIINTVGMSQVCSVPFSWLFKRGQGIKLFSFVGKISREKGFLIPVLERLEPDDCEKYEGAIVLPATKDIHFAPTVVADFNSLYPSCMISENLSHDSFIGSVVVAKDASTDFKGRPITTSKYERQILDGELEGWGYNDIVYDLYKLVPKRPGGKPKIKIVIGHKICRFARPPGDAKSIIPTILMELLDARKRTREMGKKFPKGSFRYIIYDGLQLAYKVTANSLYGQTGAITSKIRMIEIAACTTAVGRQLIQFTKKFIEDNYAGSRIIYGDTDSVFARFSCYDQNGEKLHGLDAIFKSIELCTEASIAVSKRLKKPHNLEFEKAIWPFVLASKKRYHGHYYTEYGKNFYYPNSMGLVSKRRDNAPVLKKIFCGMLDIIMIDHSLDKAKRFVTEECRKILDGEYPLEQFIVTKKLRSYYKKPDQIAHNVLAQRIGKRDPGNKPRCNERIPYAYIENPTAKLQGDKIETPTYITDNNLAINYRHYVTNQIYKPVTQIIGLQEPNAERLFDQMIQDYDYKKDGVQKITKGFKSIVPVKLNIFRRGAKQKVEEDVSSSDSDSGLDDSDSDSELD